MRTRGLLVDFRRARSYGWVRVPVGPDYFVHASDVADVAERNALRSGTVLEFEAIEDWRGRRRAVEVRVVDPRSEARSFAPSGAVWPATPERSPLT